MIVPRDPPPVGSPERLRVLVVDDDEDDFLLVRRALSKRAGTDATEVEWAPSYDRGLEAALSGTHDVCLVDYRLDAENGIALLRELRKRGYATPIILLTGQGAYEVDVEAMKAGASDYLVKSDITPAVLERSIRYSVAQARADTALRLRDEALSAVVEGIAITDARLPDNPVIHVNPGFARLTGYTTAETLGRNCRFLQGPDTDPELILRVRAAVERGEPFQGEVLNYRKDGTPFWNQMSIAPIRNPAGEVTHFVGIQQDVTERKRMVAELRSAEAHYRRLVTSAPQAIFAIDADGLLTEINPAGAALLGRAPHEILARHFAEVVAPMDLARAEQALQRLLSGDVGSLTFEISIVGRDGTERLVSVTAAGIREGHAVVGTHGIARDVTEERQREVQLRRVERMASLATLLGGVAHELNNPLHAVGNFADLLLMDPRPQQEREDLEAIVRESRRMANIVASLRVLARQSQEEERPEKQPVDLNDVVRYVLKTREYSLRTSGIEVREDLAGNSPAALADRGQMEQVVLNLVVNAEQAMAELPRPGLLILRTRASRSGVTLAIVDNGPGIARADLERIFDPFFTTKSPGEGTGLGLSLVHSIVTELGGEIRVDSEPGVGTAFSIDLPAAMPSDGAGEGETLRPPERRLRILVVEDEPALRESVTRYLTRRGHDVEAVGEGGEALSLLEEAGDAGFDAILSDLKMPGMGGEQLLRRLRDEGKGRDRRVVFLTGDAAGADVARLRTLADVPILLKPIRLDVVAEILEGRAEASAHTAG